MLRGRMSVSLPALARIAQGPPAGTSLLAAGRRRQQTRLLSVEARQAIDQAVNGTPVVLFMKGTPAAPQCGFSRASIQVLGLQGVDPKLFASYNVLEDAELREGIKEYSEWPTIPQLYVKGQFVGGCDILIDMHRSGELEKLLSEAAVLVPADDSAKTEQAENGQSAEDKPA